MVKSNTSAATVARLVDDISKDIMYGDFVTGHRLKLSEMQKRYGASQFEVRKALSQLANRQLVEHVPNAGFRVLSTNTHSREDFDYVRLLLEVPASRLVVARATDEHIAELRLLAAQFEDAIHGDDREAKSKANEAFHNRFYEISGNSVLRDSIALVRNSFDVTTSGRWNSLEGLQASASEHKSMIDAIEQRDVVALEQLVTDHIRGF